MIHPKSLAVLALATILQAGVLRSDPAQDEIRFADATSRAGLVDPLAGLMGHGGAWGDVDGDGRIDLFVGGFCDRPNAEYAPAAGPVSSRLFRNRGDGTFERVAQPPVEFFARTSGAVFADLDNNGTLELYAANNALRQSRQTLEPQRSAQLRHSLLFRNDAGKFADVSAESGACPEELFTARNVGVFDFDADGLLDLFVVEDQLGRGRGSRSVLLRNKGGLKFEVANAAAGLPDDLHGLGLAVADLNRDGRPDFFVPHPNRLFVSKGDGTYREAVELRELFAFKPMGREDWPCGAAFGDVNRDGILDLVLAYHHDPARILLYLGTKEGAASFRDATAEFGLDVLVPARVPHVELQDFDNDGWPDLYTTAAWIDDGKVTPLIFRNDGGRRFVPPRAVKAPMVYFPAGPSGDYDGDGRLDLFLINWFAGRRSTLLQNDGPKRRWLDVEARGKTVNRMGIGAQVRVFREGKLLGFQEISTGYGYASGQRAYAHFGLGEAGRVEVRVNFPNGKTVVREDQEADRLLVVEEP